VAKLFAQDLQAEISVSAKFPTSSSDDRQHTVLEDLLPLEETPIAQFEKQPGPIRKNEPEPPSVFTNPARHRGVHGNNTRLHGNKIVAPCSSAPPHDVRKYKRTHQFHPVCKGG
jgi:hypothetical protein